MRPVDAAVIVAGGHGRRLGGVDKAGLRIGDRRLIEVAVAAVAGAQIVVVGPDRALPAVTVAREDPPGSGPAAAVVAGLAVMPASAAGPVAVLGADLPGLTADLVARLADRLGEVTELDGVVAAGPDGHPQWLQSMWRLSALRAAAATRSGWADSSLRELLGPLRHEVVAASADEVADIDTPADLSRWTRPQDEGSAPFQSASHPRGS